MKRLSIIAAVFALLAAWQPVRAADSILNDVLQRGTVRIAVNTGNEPRQFVDESGNLQGYDIDIANEIGKQLGVKVEFIRTDVAGRVAMLQSHKADITVATFTPTLDRLKTVAFTDAYTTDVLMLMTRTNRTDLNSLKDFDKPEIKIALGRGSTAAKALAKYVPHATVVELPGLADIVQALDAGQIDATCSNDGLVSWTVKKSDGKYKAISETLGAPEDDSIGLPQGDFVWWMWLNQFVHQINEDGTNYTLWVKWFGTQPPSFVKPPPKGS
ncbi:MAG TPA: transporter substrate-binding domain-containing protein [Stellaceae bacterium]|nr:transporter substrate-binding domain-containing protein [Stellaceae bacterium]